MGRTRTRLVLAAVLLAVAGLVRPAFRRVEVVGDSMRPALEPGDRLLLRRPGRRGRALRPGDLVAVADPRQPVRIVVKRLVSVDPGGLEIRGDNTGASTDSRNYGRVGPAAVRGRVVYRYHPPPRRGRLGRCADGPGASHPPGGNVVPVLQAEFDRILAPGYLGDLPSRSLEEIRSLRDDSTQVAEKVSYLRRLVHARIDIVLGEIRRRAAGGAPADLSRLVEDLNGVLAENVQSPGHERMVSPAPPPGVDEITAEFDSALGRPLSDLPDLSDDDIRALADRLAEIDRDLSPKRRAVFERVDALGQELTRRYGSGEATVDSVLR